MRPQGSDIEAAAEQRDGAAVNNFLARFIQPVLI
jgi:hypothetical protein